MQIVKGMAPSAAVAMDEVERVGPRLKARGRAGSSCGFLPGEVLQLSHANSDSAAFGQTCEHAYATDADVVADRRKRKARAP